MAKSKGDGSSPTEIITLEKLKIFERYTAIGRGYDHVSPKHLKKLSYHEFMLIDRLVQDLKLVKKGLAADSYAQQVNYTIEKTCDCEQAVKYLKVIASKV